MAWGVQGHLGTPRASWSTLGRSGPPQSILERPGASRTVPQRPGGRPGWAGWLGWLAGLAGLAGPRSQKIRFRSRRPERLKPSRILSVLDTFGPRRLQGYFRDTGAVSLADFCLRASILRCFCFGGRKKSSPARATATFSTGSKFQPILDL